MPEIPEIEIYKNYLNQYIINKPIKKIMVYRPKSININVEEFENNLVGKHISEINRKGKLLIFNIGEINSLLCHVMLDGRLYYISPDIASSLNNDLEDAKHLKKSINGMPGTPSVLFCLSDGSMLFFCKLTLGYLHYVDKTNLQKHLSQLGPDPFVDNMQAKEFNELLQGKRGKIKPWLINQKNISGVGNAYSNEALFGAGILPVRQIPTLEMEEKNKLFSSLKQIMQDSINMGGDMEEPFAPWDNFTGGFIPQFMVYDREGKECKVCGNTIIREEVGGRNSFFCKVCQK